MLKLTLRDDYWHVTGTVATVDGERVRVRKSTGFPRHQRALASEAMSRLLKEVHLGAHSTRKAKEKDATVAEAVRLYMTRPEGVGKTEKIVLNKFMADFASVPLSGLTIADIMTYVTARGNMPSTVAREINVLNAMLAHARDMQLEGAPTWRLKRPSVDDSRMRWLTAEERDQFIEASDEDIADLLTFLFFTGARLGEALVATDKDVVDGCVLLRTKKGKMKKVRTRSVPLHDRAKAAVEGKTGLLFPSPTGGVWERGSFYKRFYRGLERCGLEDFRPHDCRHTFASLLVQKGASLRVVADLLGHTSLAMVMRYAHLAPTHLESAIGLLGGDE